VPDPEHPFPTLHPARPDDLGRVAIPDDAGNMIEIEDQSGSVLAYQYDALNRRTDCDITPATGVGGDTTESWGYDALGRPTYGARPDSSGRSLHFSPRSQTPVAGTKSRRDGCEFPASLGQRHTVPGPIRRLSRYTLAHVRGFPYPEHGARPGTSVSDAAARETG
jgi:hypothetical protein